VAEHFATMVVDDDALERGLTAARYAIDTRLRDVLRSLRPPGADSSLVPSPPEEPVCFPRPSVAEDAAYAGETAILVGIDGAVRAEQRVVALERRLAQVERTSLGRLRARARRRRAAAVD
jgi:hypothetical protein